MTRRVISGKTPHHAEKETFGADSATMFNRATFLGLLAVCIAQPAAIVGQDTLHVELPEVPAVWLEMEVRERLVADYKLWQKGEFPFGSVCVYGQVEPEHTRFEGKTVLHVLRIIESKPEDCPAVDAYSKGQLFGLITFTDLKSWRMTVQELIAVSCAALENIHKRVELIRIWGYMYGTHWLRRPSGEFQEVEQVARCMYYEKGGWDPPAPEKTET